MKNILILALILGFSGVAFADVQVNGYYRQNGTYVQPYTRTSPNTTRVDNYSTQGNTNPYTGQAGTVNINSNSFSNSYPNSGLGSYSSNRSSLYGR